MDDPTKSDQYNHMVDIDPWQLLEGENPRLLDEWQIAPKLWDCVRREVDRRSKPGQFILTGSYTPADTSTIFHSGTGRFSWLLMHTMTLFESQESTGQVSINNLINAPKTLRGINSLNLESLAYLVCRGGWPYSLDLSKNTSLQQSNNYYEAVLRTEINSSDGINKNKDRVALLMRSLARNQCSSCSINTIKNDIQNSDSGNISVDTITKYIQALKNIFLVEDMQAWNPNLRSKIAIRTTPTRYFTDPSIAVAALELGPKDLINDLNTFGLFFEAMCVRDLRVYAQANDASLYHYRDKSGLECDAVMHFRKGNYGLIEIKLGGDKLIEEGADSLKTLAGKIDTTRMKDPSFLMVLVGVGDYAYRRKDGVYVVPIGCLKN